MRLFELLTGQPIMQKGDKPEWFTSREHMQMIGLDVQLANVLRAEFHQPDIDVDCGVDGHIRHFRIGGVGIESHGVVCDRARDILSHQTPYRFEVQCV
jgi:hypothetical protein